MTRGRRSLARLRSATMSEYLISALWRAPNGSPTTALAAAVSRTSRDLGW